MARQKLGSLTYQAECILKSGYTPGESKRRARRDGSLEWKILSWKTLKRLLNVLVIFLKFCDKHHKVRFAGDVTPEMARRFIRQRRVEGKVTMRTDWGAIKKADVLMKRMGWRDVDAPPLLTGGFGIGGEPQPNPVPPEKFEDIARWLDEHFPDPIYAWLARIEFITGLRPSEAIYLRAEAISEDGRWVNLGRGDHTKGGRPRVVEVTTPEGREFMLQMRQHGLKRRDGYVFQGRAKLLRPYERNFKAACNAAGLEEADHTPHDLRATNANVEYARHREAGLNDRKAKKKVSRHLGHGRVSVLDHYWSPSLLPVQSGGRAPDQ
jgi:integrase